MDGIVKKNQNGYFYLINEQNEIYIAKARGLLKRGCAILVGDRVEYRVNSDGTATILAIHDRTSELFRPPVANIHELVVTASVISPDFNQLITDTMLVIASHAGVKPIVCITKADLAKEEAWRIAEAYTRAGYDSFTVSLQFPDTVEALQNHLHGPVIAFTGPSGAGKSSLINRLLGREQFASGNVSEKTKRGKNTTRHAELVRFRDTAFLMDTPGYTSLGIQNMGVKELAGYFPEFHSLSQPCRFNDCRHMEEPGCAVHHAVMDGVISRTRYESYRRMYGELKDKS